jgi:RHS repeat-associated protein
MAFSSSGGFKMRVLFSGDLHKRRKVVVSVLLIATLILNLFPPGIIRYLPAAAMIYAQANTALTLELSVMAKNGQNDLSWRSLDGTTTIEGYNVYRSATSTGDYEKLNQSPLLSQAYIDSDNIVDGVVYYYKIEAVGSGGTSAGYSNVASVKLETDTTSTALSGINTDTSGTIQDVSPSVLPAPTNLIAVAAGTDRIDLTWAIATETTEVNGYEIERSTDGIEFNRIGISDTNSFIDSSVVPGATFFYKVRANGNDGRNSGYSNTASETLHVTRYEESDSSVSKNINWVARSNSSYSEGYELCAATTESISFIFTGSAVSWISTKGKDRGIAIVSIDDSATQTIDLYAPDTLYKQVVYSKSGLSNTDHIIKVQVSGTRNYSSIANTVSVDAFDVLGEFSSTRYEETSTNIITKTGAWEAYCSSQFSDGYEIANSSTGTISFSFTGTTIDWISTKDRDRGKAVVTIDDGLTQTVDLYSPMSAFNQTVYRKTGLTNTEHTIRIAVAENKNYLSTGYKIGIDAFDVRKTGDNPTSSIRYEESDKDIVRTGNWFAYKGAGYSRGYMIASASSDSTATFTFTGANISWVSSKTSASGIAKVRVDEEAVEEVDLYATTSTPVYNRVVFSKTGLAYGTHTIEIGVSDKKGLASSGHNICIDAFTVSEEQTLAVTASPAGSVFDTTQTVYLNANKPAAIYYTTDGTTPTVSSIRYIGFPLTVSRTTLLRYMAVDQTENSSIHYMQKYILNNNPMPEVMISSLYDNAECSGDITITAFAIGEGPIGNMSFTITKYGTDITRGLGTTIGMIDVLRDSRIIDTTKLPDAEYVITVTVENGMRQNSNRINIKVNNNKARLGEGYWGMFSIGYGKADMANGNYLFKQRDISLPGPGLGIDVTRIYNSLSNTNGPLGWGWRLSVPELAEYSDGSVCITRGDGARVIYTQNEDGSYCRPAGYYQILTKNANNSFTWMFKDQSRYEFDSTRTVEYDNNGNKVIYQYDTEGKLVTILDPINRVTTFNYNPLNGKLQSVTDYTDRTWNYSYDVDLNLSTATNPLGHSVKYTYDRHKMVGITDEENHTVSFDYTGDKLSAVHENPDETTTYTSVFGYLLSGDFTATNAKGHTTLSKLDSNSIVTSVINPDGSMASFAYDNNFNLLTRTDFRGNTYTYTYDSNGNIRSIKDPLGGITNYTYDDRNNLLSSMNPRGYKTKYAYDDECNLVRRTNALGGEREYAYDDFGNKISETDEVTQTTIYEYDVAGNNVSVKDPLNHVVKFSYDNRGNKIGTTDANGAATSYGYDALGCPIKVIDPEGDQVCYEYDRTGRKVKDIDSYGKTTLYVYDWLGRETAETNPLGHSFTCEYDSLGNKIKDIDPTGKVTEYGYNNLNQMESVKVTVSDTSTTVTSYTYDANGNKLTTTDNKGFVTSWQYDPLNRVIKTIKPGNRVETTSYDANGNVVNGVKPDSRTSESDYDALDRVTAIRYYKSNGSFDKEILYTYYSDGKRQTKKDNQGLTTYIYDAANNLTKEQRSNGVISYAYDATNKLKSRNLGGKGLQYNYDKADCLTSIVDTDTNISIVSYAYDSNKNRTSINCNNGTTAACSYDFANKITKLENKYFGNRLLSSYSYTYYNNNLLRTETGPIGASSYKYDGEKKLTEISGPGNQTIQYSFDTLGNRTRSFQTVDRREYETIYNYDTPTNELTDVITQDSTTTFSYDANGSLVKRERFRKPIMEQKSVLVEGCNDASKWISGDPIYFPVSQETSDIKEGTGAVKVSSEVPADFTDDFNRVNSYGNLGPKWTYKGTGYNSFEINSNCVIAAEGYYHGYQVYNVKSNYTDCAISCIPSAYGTTRYAHPTLIIRSNGGNRSDGANSMYGGNAYYADISYNSISLYRSDNGWMGTQVGGWSGSPLGKTVKLQAIGNNLTVFVDGQKVIDVIDNTYSSGYCGIGNASRYNCSAIDDVRINAITSDYTKRYITCDLGSGKKEDLSNADTLSFWLKSSTAGDYVFSFGEGSPTEQTYDFTSQANTWTKYTWDISNKPLSARNSVRYFRLATNNANVSNYPILLDGITKQFDPDYLFLEGCNDLSGWIAGDYMSFPISQETSDIKEGAGAIKVTSTLPADFTDNFNRADSLGDLGPNWAYKGNNYNAFRISSNRVVAAEGYYHGYQVYNGKSDYTDCAISCVPSGNGGSNEACPMLIIRSDGTNCSDGANSAYGGNAYYAVVFDHAIELRKSDNGWCGEEIGYWDGNAFGKTVKLQAIGNNLTVFVDGQKVIDVIDNTYSSGYCGIGNYYRFDNSVIDDIKIYDYPNRFITRDLGSGNEEDLSNADTLSFWLKSSIAADYSFSFGESSATEQTYNFKAQANTWTKYTWDIYSMPASVRDAVRYFRLRLDSTPTATSTILLDEITTRNHDATTTYEYNADNQLTKVVTKPGLDTTQTITFTYNGDNERIQKTVVTVASDITTTETINYVYDGSEIAQERDDRGNTIAEYIYDENSVPVSVTKNGRIYYFHYDGLGNVVSLTNSDGRIVSTCSYDAWGNIMGRTGTIETPYTYRGKYGYVYDKETALYFLQSRYYDPQIGRFTTKDRFEGFDERPLSQNPYVYCENDPINNMDPDGQWGSEVHNAMTYDMALKAGLSKGDAMWLGQVNEWFDNLDNPAICPQAHFDINPTDTDSRDTYFNEHFNNAVDLMRKYNKTGDSRLKADAFVELAGALHARQDKYAHLTIFHQDWYDDTKTQPERFANAKEATRQVLVEFSNLTKLTTKPNPKAKTKIKQLASAVQTTSISRSGKLVSSLIIKSIKQAAIAAIKRR